MESKIEIRRRVSGRRATASLIDASEKIVDRLVDFLTQQKIDRVASYSSLPDEVSLDGLTHRLPNVAFCYPRVQGSELQFFQVESRSDLRPGAFNISEPDPQVAQQISPDAIPLMIVPGVAFDREGQRLGRGKGYYDRFLQNYSGLKIGACGSWQIEDQLPTEPHDVAMDYVVTEKFILRPLRTVTKGTHSSWNRNP